MTPNVIVNGTIARMYFLDISKINYTHLYKLGFRAICFDKDNVLTSPYSDAIEQKFLPCLREAMSFFDCAVLSNSINKSAFLTKEDVSLPCIAHIRNKPFASNELLKHFSKYDRDKIILIGDRLLTDVVMAKRCGVLSIYVSQPITVIGEHKGAMLLRNVEQRLARFFPRTTAFGRLSTCQLNLVVN